MAKANIIKVEGGQMEECFLCDADSIEMVFVPTEEIGQYTVLCDSCHGAHVSHGVVTENAVSVPEYSHKSSPIIFFPFFL